MFPIPPIAASERMTDRAQGLSGRYGSLPRRPGGLRQTLVGVLHVLRLPPGADRRELYAVCPIGRVAAAQTSRGSAARRSGGGAPAGSLTGSAPENCHGRIGRLPPGRQALTQLEDRLRRLRAPQQRAAYGASAVQARHNDVAARRALRAPETSACRT